MNAKFNRHLLTHYPLIWNTRVVWVLGANLLLHLFFFLTGFASVTASEFSRHGSVWDVGGGGLITFSILCTLLVLIVWLLYYLRNNAFKNFYPIDRWHLARETAIIFVLVFTSISYFHSFHYGVRVRTRTITPVAVFREELNTVNRAMAFIPIEKKDYFVLENCDHHPNGSSYQDNVNYFDTTLNYGRDTMYNEIRQALRRPDAFSYRNYCKLEQGGYSYSGNARAEALSARNRAWIEGNRKDSIRNLLLSFFRILDKYKVNYRLDADHLTEGVFALANNAPADLIPTEQYYSDPNGERKENRFYIERYDLSQALSFVDEGLSHRQSDRNQLGTLTVIGYVALCFSILLLCYRRFTRRIFLISIIGSIVWAILIGLLLMGAHGSETSFASVWLFFFGMFLVAALVSLRTGSGRTLTGATLSWHLFLLPFVMMLIQMILNDQYDHYEYSYNGNLDREALMQQQHPFLYWVNHHSLEIIIANLFLVLLYLAFVFNRWAKRWMEMAEE